VYAISVGKPFSSSKAAYNPLRQFQRITSRCLIKQGAKIACFLAHFPQAPVELPTVVFKLTQIRFLATSFSSKTRDPFLEDFVLKMMSSQNSSERKKKNFFFFPGRPFTVIGYSKNLRSNCRHTSDFFPPLTLVNFCLLKYWGRR